jgi:hypothetical protein
VPEYKEVKELTDEGYEFIDANDIKRYYYNGKLHREGGPAIIRFFGLSTWYVHGVVHREDGPAEVMNDGMEFKERFFLDGEEVDGTIFRAILQGPLEGVPLHINTVYAPVAKKRLESTNGQIHPSPHRNW